MYNMRKVLILCSLICVAVLVKAQEYIPHLETETISVFDSINMNNNRITKLADPIDSMDAINFRTLKRNS